MLLKQQFYAVPIHCISVINREAALKTAKNASGPNRSLSLLRIGLGCSSLYWIRWIGKWCFQISLQFYIQTVNSVKALFCMGRGVLYRLNTWNIYIYILLLVLPVLTKISLHAGKPVGSEHSLSLLNCLRIQKWYVKFERTGKISVHFLILTRRGSTIMWNTIPTTVFSWLRVQYRLSRNSTSPKFSEALCRKLF